jgi:hypothetical protein
MRAERPKCSKRTTMRSAEFASNIDPTQARKHLAALTAMQQLYGETYNVGNFFRDQPPASRCAWPTPSSPSACSRP